MSDGRLLSLASGPGTDRDAALERAAELLRRGGVVSFATDTYYALGVDPLNGSAVDRVFRIKQRRRSMPLPVLVAGMEQAEALLGRPLPAAAAPLVEACWPGPLTLVLAGSRLLPEGVAGPGGTVGLRWPRWPDAEALLRHFGGCITGSSANRTGTGGPDLGTVVAEQLGDELDLVLDSGPSPGGPGSTVIRLEEDRDGSRLVLLRPGRLDPDWLSEISELPLKEKAGI